MAKTDLMQHHMLTAFYLSVVTYKVKSSQVKVLWVVMQYSAAVGYQHFRGCLLLQGEVNSQQPTSGPYPEQDKSSPQLPTILLSNIILPFTHLCVMSHTY